MALSRGELDLTFLNDLTQDELSLARDLIRRNLPVRHTSIFQGVEALHDEEAAPILRKMLGEETSLSWRRRREKACGHRSIWWPTRCVC